MKRTTTHAQHPSQPVTARVDLSVARRLARGPAQRTWLEELVSDTGLVVALHLPRRYSSSTYDRMTGYLTKLWAAGYEIHQELGPRGGRGTWYLRGYKPDSAPNRGVAAALGYDVAFRAAQPWLTEHLLQMLDDADSETVQNATELLDLVSWFMWSEFSFDTPKVEVLSRILDACRTPPVVAPGAQTRAELLLGARGAVGTCDVSLEQAAGIADAITIAAPSD